LLCNIAVINQHVNRLILKYLRNDNTKIKKQADYHNHPHINMGDLGVDLFFTTPVPEHYIAVPVMDKTDNYMGVINNCILSQLIHSGSKIPVKKQHGYLLSLRFGNCCSNCNA
jgi:hypothetical protein